MGFMDVLKGVGKAGLGFLAGGPVGAIGAGIGAISQGKAQNRGEKLGGQFDLEQILMARDRDLLQRQMSREEEGRASGNDAWKRMLAAQRVKHPGPRPQLAGKYSTPSRVSTPTEMQGADAMTAEVMARLQGGNPIPQQGMRELAIDPKLMDPGLMERLLGYGAAGLSAWGALRPTPQPPVIPSKRVESMPYIDPNMPPYRGGEKF